MDNIGNQNQIGFKCQNNKKNIGHYIKTVFSFFNLQLDNKVFRVDVVNIAKLFEFKGYIMRNIATLEKFFSQIQIYIRYVKLCNCQNPISNSKKAISHRKNFFLPNGFWVLYNMW